MGSAGLKRQRLSIWRLQTVFGLDSISWRGAGNWLASFFQNIFRI
jgi:hypothetical protein